MTRFAPVYISPETLRHYHEVFLRTLRDKQKETQVTYRRSLKAFQRWYGEGPLCRFRLSDIERYKEYLQNERGCAPASISTYLTALRCFCQYLVSEGVLDGNPAAHIKGFSRPSGHSRDTLSPAEVIALLGSVDPHSIQGKRNLAIITIMLEHGLAEIELIRADLSDLDLRQGTLVVQGKGKKSKEESVQLSAKSQEVLQLYLECRPQSRASEPLFQSEGNRTQGARMTTRGIRSMIKVQMGRAGIEHEENRRISAHSLRHTAALMMALRGATPQELRRNLRLGTLTTAMIYFRQAHHIPFDT